MSDAGLHRRALDALRHPHPVDKCRLTRTLHEDFLGGRLGSAPEPPPEPLPQPGRPVRPPLVPFAQLPRRGLGSQAGRVALAHALAHIEFNAINLALDAVYRFRGQPSGFYRDWLHVASEEATHFELLCAYLDAHGCAYGDHPAHGGLWDAACRTAHDVLARMALVPRVLEARGLDVTPGLVEKLERAGDERLAAVLRRIYRDEIGHVRIGSRWFRRCCEARGVEPRQAFRELVRAHLPARPRGPFNEAGRLAAGFSTAELDDLREMAG